MPYRIGTPPLFGTVFIEDTNDREGWSESYWVNKGDYGAALEALTRIWNKRRQLLPDDFLLSGFRVSSTLVKGDSKVLFPSFAANSPYARGSWNDKANDDVQSMPNNTCLFYRMEGSPGGGLGSRHVTRPLHGLPQSLFGALEDSSSGNRDITAKGVLWKRLQEEFAEVLKKECLIVLKKTGAPDPPDIDPVHRVTIDTVQFPLRARYRKIGRPFDLLRGRR